MCLLDSTFCGAEHLICITIKVALKSCWLKSDWLEMSLILTYMGIASVRSCAQEHCAYANNSFSLFFSVADSKLEVGLVVQVVCLVFIYVWEVS